MLVVLSPAKTMDISACDTSVELTEPSFESCTQELVQILQSYDKAALQKQADLVFAQQHVRILDALYGILKPLDSIKPYRLEMSNKISTIKGSGLYNFWGNLLSDFINRELSQASQDPKFIINCASQEYFEAIKISALHYPVYTMSFPGPSVYAKAARGAMVRFIVKERVSKPEQLRSFKGVDGEWSYNVQQSTEQQFVFVRGTARKCRSAGQPRSEPQADSKVKAKSRPGVTETADKQSPHPHSRPKRQRH